MHFLLFHLILLVAYPALAQPTITNFSPNAGPSGTTVTITGTNFNPSAGANIVYFGSVKAPITAATATSLTVTVPQGATYSPISVTTNQLTAYSNLPFGVTGTTGCGSTGFNFANNVTYAATSYPRHVSTGDIDGDGKTDMVVINNTGASFSVFRNTSVPGTVSMAPKVDFPTGNNPFSSFLGDLDGDGKLDAVVVSLDEHKVSLYRNTSTPGIISFEPRVDLTTGMNPLSVRIADFDKDGRPDIVVTNTNSHSISVFKNIGTGTIAFATKIDFQVGTWPQNVATGDLNGDGYVDIVVTNYDDNTISILRNTHLTGISAFAPPVNYATQTNPFAVAIGDLDGDNKPEVAVTNSGSGTFSIYPNTSASGNISLGSPFSMNAGASTPLWISFADLNGNSKPDLAVVGFSSNNISLFNNNSTPGALIFSSPLSTSTGNYPRCVAISDVDGDGRLDLAITESVGNTFSLQWNASSLKVNATTVAAACGNNNGSITATGIGGSGPYTYSIDGANFQAGNSFTSLAPGNYLVYVKDATGCLDDTAVVISSGCLSLNANAGGTTCGNSNGSITITASNGQPPYAYSKDGVNFQSSNIFNALAAGNYTITVRDALGVTGSISVDIEGSSALQASAFTTAATCSNNDGVISILPIADSYQYSLDGTNFQPNNNFNGVATGNYTVYVRAGNGCMGTAQIQVGLINDLVVNAGNDLTICEGTKVMLPAQSNGTSFSWTPALGLSNASILQPEASPKITTRYTLTTTKGACSASSTVTVFVDPAPVADAGKDTSLCLGKNIQLHGSGGIIYTWSPASYLDDPASDQPWVINPPAGKWYYILNVKDSKGCSSLKPDSVMITVTKVAVSLGNDTVVAMNQPVQLKAVDVNNSRFTTYSWFPTNGLDHANIPNPVAVTDREITYRVIVETADGCQGTDEINIKVYKGPNIYVPNAFTPDGNRKNDVLKAIPVGIRTFQHFTVYNRWGQKVFSTASADKGWDGQVNGIPQSGGFVWVAEGIDYRGLKVMRRGMVIVLR